MCVQNYVAMDFSANVLLAAGASPAMASARGESWQMRLFGTKRHLRAACVSALHLIAFV